MKRARAVPWVDEPSLDGLLAAEHRPAVEVVVELASRAPRCAGQCGDNPVTDVVERSWSVARTDSGVASTCSTVRVRSSAWRESRREATAGPAGDENGR